MNLRKTVLFVVVLIDLLICFANGIRFYLKPGERRCFTEDLPSGQKINAETRVSAGKGEMNIDVWIATLQGKVLYHRNAVDHGKFSFQTPSPQGYAPELDEESGVESYNGEEDTYKVCIEHQQAAGRVHEPGTRRAIFIHFEDSLSMRPQEMLSRVASSKSTDQLQVTMRQMHTTLAGMIGDLSQLQTREKSLTSKIKGTTRQVTILSSLALVVICITSFLQFQYYKGYFKQKKLC